LPVEAFTDQCRECSFADCEIGGVLHSIRYLAPPTPLCCSGPSHECIQSYYFALSIEMLQRRGEHRSFMSDDLVDSTIAFYHRVCAESTLAAGSTPTLGSVH
jgi:hypothetical protein